MNAYSKRLGEIIQNAPTLYSFTLYGNSIPPEKKFLVGSVFTDTTINHEYRKSNTVLFLLWKDGLPIDGCLLFWKIPTAIIKSLDENT